MGIKMDEVASWIKNDHLRFVVWYFEDGAPKRYYPDFVVRLTNGAHVVVETKGQKDKSAQIKRKALQGWVKEVNSMGTWGKWVEVFSTHPGDLEGLVGKLFLNDEFEHLKAVTGMDSTLSQ